MEEDICKTCDSVLVKGETINSGNSLYQIFYCKQCDSKITKCIGLNKS